MHRKLLLCISYRFVTVQKNYNVLQHSYNTSYLEKGLILLHFFLLTIIKITIHNIKLMMTIVDTVPAIAGSGVELEEEDEPVIGGCSITVRIIHMHTYMWHYSSIETIMVTSTYVAI